MDDGLPQITQLNRRLASRRPLAQVLLLATALVLLPATAQAQNSAPHSEAARRAMLEAQSVNAQPAGPVQAIDVSVGEALDRSVHNDVLELRGDASGNGGASPADEPMMMMVRRGAPPNRQGSTQPGSQPASAAADDVASDNGPAAVAAPLQPFSQPPDPALRSQFPVTFGSIGRTTRSRTQPWKEPATRGSSVRASGAPAPSARLRGEPSGRRNESTAVRNSSILLPSSHPQAHTRRPHHRSTASPFSTFISSQ